MVSGPHGVRGIPALKHVVKERNSEYVIALTHLHPMVEHSVLVKDMNLTPAITAHVQVGLYHVRSWTIFRLML